MPNPDILVDLYQQAVDHRQRRIERQAKMPPAVLAEHKRRKEEIRPRAEYLMGELGMSPPEAWLVAHNDEAWYSGQRAEVLIKAGEMSPTASRSSVGKIVSGRRNGGLLTTPDAAKKPGETPQQYYQRLRRQISQLGVPAGRTGETTAKGLDAGQPDVALAAEKSEAAYAAKKRTLLASEKARAREAKHQADAAASATLAQSTRIKDRALRYMAERRQSTDPKAATFHEDYRRALRALENVK